jgi:hypothetical protein
MERDPLLIERYNNDGSKRIEYCILTNKCILWSRIFWWFSPGTLVSSTNTTDRHDITEILLKVALQTPSIPSCNIAQSNGSWLINWLMFNISDQYFSFINDYKFYVNGVELMVFILFSSNHHCCIFQWVMDPFPCIPVDPIVKRLMFSFQVQAIT